MHYQPPEFSHVPQYTHIYWQTQLNKCIKTYILTFLFFYQFIILKTELDNTLKITLLVHIIYYQYIWKNFLHIQYFFIVSSSINRSLNKFTPVTCSFTQQISKEYLLHARMFSRPCEYMINAVCWIRDPKNISIYSLISGTCECVTL